MSVKDSIGGFHSVVAPWETSTQAVRDAAGALGMPTNTEAARVNQIMGLMSEQVRAYLNGGTAPTVVWREAYARLWAWAKEAPSGALKSRQIGANSVDYELNYNFPAAMRVSGVKFLLAPYRKRSASTARHDDS